MSPRIALFLAGCAAFLNLYATQGLLTELAGTFGVSARQAGWSITVTTLAVAITAPFVGRLTAGAAQHRVIAVAAMLLALPAVLAAWASGFGEFLFWRGVQGMLIPVVFATSVAYIGVRWSGGAVSEATSVYVAGTILGGFCGRFLTGLVTEYADWRLALSLLGALSLVMGALILWLLPRNPVAPAPVLVDRAAAAGELWRRPLLAAYAVGFCVLFSQVATFTYAGLHLGQAPFSLGSGALGTIYAVFLLALVVIPIAGRLSKARPQGELVKVAAWLGVTGSLLTLASTLWLIVLGLALSSTGVFLAQAAANAFTTSHARYNKAGAVGLYLTSYYLGGSFGAWVPGALWEQWGWPGCVALIVVFQLLSLFVAWTFWKPAAQPGYPLPRPRP
ncbi:MFS transporter [Pseudomonas vanderleydeniana]|uniref:MFS transporter n=1 Tax=Pseudomonas vanderleydeniana TaxID=2745495 RepID=A0A9E6TQP7_9PSED|nr:MFS transporter [Pseudomonas vanderleydeniana]QXI26711.1 MFS transporter [Pseudomonas vanderleydeniana]